MTEFEIPDQQAAYRAEYIALRDAHLEKPDSFEPLRDFGLFLAQFTVHETTADAIRLLVRATQLSPSEGETARILVALLRLFYLSGDLERALRMAETLTAADRIPNEYIPMHAEICLRLGLRERAERTYASLLADARETSFRIMHERAEPICVHLIADSDETLIGFGELGIRFALFVQACELGMIPRATHYARAFLLAKNKSISNRFLLDLWKAQASKHVQMVASSDEWERLSQAYKGTEIYLDVFTIPDGPGVNLWQAAPYIMSRWYDERREPVLRLPEETRRAGRKWLASLGVPEDAWFVCLHVRDGGHRAESAAAMVLRNADPATYVPAVREIVARGGWVIRMGNRSPFGFDGIAQVIDYAGAADKEDWKDIFLISQCRFVFGTMSGPHGVAPAFGVPCLFTNQFPVALLYGSPADLAITKLLRRTEDDRYLSIREAAAGRLGWELSPAYLARIGIAVEPNSQEGILAVLVEMFDRLEGRFRATAEDRRKQREFHAACVNSPFGLGLNIGRAFVDDHPFLLDRPGAANDV